MLRQLLALAALAALAVPLVPGCGGEKLNLADYDTSCQEDVDCVGVYIGDCASCMCPNAAINRADQAKYTGDVQALGCSSAAGCDCAAVKVACQHGTCAVAH